MRSLMNAVTFPTASEIQSVKMRGGACYKVAAALEVIGNAMTEMLQKWEEEDRAATEAETAVGEPTELDK